MKRAGTAGRGDGAADGSPSAAERFPEFPGYRLVAPVASATRDQVWRARRSPDGTLVAIKAFPAEDAARATREAEIAAVIEHPHVVAPSDVVFADPGAHGGGSSPGLDVGPRPTALGESVDVESRAAADSREIGRAAVGLVLPWYDDGSLADLIAVRRRLRWREVLTVLIPLADALASAHERDFVHGDISPANVLFDQIGRPMLSDFGAARAATEAGAEVYATPCHVAPEIVRGAAPSPATDLFSLGSVALTCLTGRAAWLADDLQDVLIQSTAGQWPDLEDNMAPPALRVLVRRLLAPQAEDRGSAGGLSVDLRRVGDPEPVELVSLDDDASAAQPLAVRSATMVRPDALRPPADDWGPPPRPVGSRIAELLDAAHRGARFVTSRLSWRGAAAMGAVAVLAWVAIVLGEASGQQTAPVAWASDGVGSAGSVASIADAERRAPAAAISVTAAADPSVGQSPDSRRQPEPDPPGYASDKDWLAVVVRLDRARAAAFVTRDATLLTDVYVPEAPARRDDEARIDALRDAHARVHNATHEVLAAELVELGPDGSVALDVRQTQHAYTVYDADGRPAGTTQPVPESVRRVYLRPAEGGFRIVRIEDGGGS